MNGSSLSDVPPGFEEFFKGSALNKLGHRDGPTSKNIIKVDNQPQLVRTPKGTGDQRERIYKLSQLLKKILWESTAHLKSACNLHREAVPNKKSHVEHITTLLLALQHTKGSTVHLKKVCLTEEVFDPKSLPTKNPSENIIEWFTRNHKDYIFQLRREDNTSKPLYLQPRSRVEVRLNHHRAAQSMKSKKCAGTINTVLDAMPISSVKPNEEIIRSMQNKKEFITELKGASKGKRVLNSPPKSYVNPMDRLLQNKKEFAALLKAVFAAKNATPISRVEPNIDQLIQAVQKDKEPAIEPKTPLQTSSRATMNSNEANVQYLASWIGFTNTQMVSPTANKTIRVATERLGWMEVDFKLPHHFDPTGMDLNKLIMPLSGIQDAETLKREFSFAERLVNWFVEVRTRVTGKYDIYFYHTKSPRMFRSSSEVMRFIMYEAYPGRPTQSSIGGGELHSSDEKQGKEKRRRRNEFVSQDNEETWGQLVDQIIGSPGSGDEVEESDA